MEEVKDYLTNTTTSKKNNIQSEQAIISPLEVFEEIPTEKVELILPKMSELKPRKNEVRNKISIKDGKLNLTTMSWYCIFLFFILYSNLFYKFATNNCN